MVSRAAVQVRQPAKSMRRVDGMVLTIFPNYLGVWEWFGELGRVGWVDRMVPLLRHGRFSRFVAVVSAHAPQPRGQRLSDKKCAWLDVFAMRISKSKVYLPAVAEH